jgi:hypothetical protein
MYNELDEVILFIRTTQQVVTLVTTQSCDSFITGKKSPGYSKLVASVDLACLVENALRQSLSKRINLTLEILVGS